VGSESDVSRPDQEVENIKYAWATWREGHLGASKQHEKRDEIKYRENRLNWQYTENFRYAVNIDGKHFQTSQKV